MNSRYADTNRGTGIGSDQGYVEDRICRAIEAGFSPAAAKYMERCREINQRLTIEAVLQHLKDAESMAKDERREAVENWWRWCAYGLTWFLAGAGLMYGVVSL